MDQEKPQGAHRNRKISVIIGLCFLFAAVVAVLLLASNQATSPSNSETNQSTSTPGPQASTSPAQTYTVADVAAHNTADDCWTIISGKVYNLTSYIPRHRGGDDITLACGIDGTTLFTQREKSDGTSVGSGMPHSAQANSDLAKLQIGVVAN